MTQTKSSAYSRSGHLARRAVLAQQLRSSVTMNLQRKLEGKGRFRSWNGKDEVAVHSATSSQRGAELCVAACAPVGVSVEAACVLSGQHAVVAQSHQTLYLACMPFIHLLCQRLVMS